MIATDPMKLNLAQANLLRLVGEAGVVGLDRNSWPVSLEFNSLQALERRGLVTLKTEPTGYVHPPAWKQTWLVTGLGLDVLKAGVVHTQHEQQAGGQSAPRLLVFLNGRQVGELHKVGAGWQGIDLKGNRSLFFPKRTMAVAWAAGGAR